MKLNSGTNLGGLRQVSVQIERLQCDETRSDLPNNNSTMTKRDTTEINQIESSTWETMSQTIATTSEKSYKKKSPLSSKSVASVPRRSSLKIGKSDKSHATGKRSRLDKKSGNNFQNSPMETLTGNQSSEVEQKSVSSHYSERTVTGNQVGEEKKDFVKSFLKTSRNKSGGQDIEADDPFEKVRRHEKESLIEIPAFRSEEMSDEGVQPPPKQDNIVSSSVNTSAEVRSKVKEQKGKQGLQKSSRKIRKIRRFTPLKKRNAHLKPAPDILGRVLESSETLVEQNQTDTTSGPVVQSEISPKKYQQLRKMAMMSDLARPGPLKKEISPTKSDLNTETLTPNFMGQFASGSGQNLQSSQMESQWPSSSSNQQSSISGSNIKDESSWLSNHPGGNESTTSQGGRKMLTDHKKEPKLSDLKPCKTLVPKYIIRPAPIPAAPKHVRMNDGENHSLDQAAWMAVFRYLSFKELVRCLKVCKTWYRWVMDPSLWHYINLNNTSIKQTHLIGLVKRQPRILDLANTNISYRQLEWLIARIPHLKQLNLAGNSWPAVSALCSSCCPLFTTLDLSWVSGVFDQCIRDLLSPPIEHRPGVDNTTSRFHNCIVLDLTGCDISDKALIIVKHNLPKIERLCISCCTKITDAGIETLSGITSLRYLDISKCHGLTVDAFQHLEKMSNLKQVKICPAANIFQKDIAGFCEKVSGNYLSNCGGVLCLG